MAIATVCFRWSIELMVVLRQLRLTDKGASTEQSSPKTLHQLERHQRSSTPEQEVRSYSSLSPLEYGENPSSARSTVLNPRTNRADTTLNSSIVTAIQEVWLNNRKVRQCPCKMDTRMTIIILLILSLTPMFL